jgi:hypothetical protein
MDKNVLRIEEPGAARVIGPEIARLKDSAPERWRA